MPESNGDKKKASLSLTVVGLTVVGIVVLGVLAYEVFKPSTRPSKLDFGPGPDTPVVVVGGSIKVQVHQAWQSPAGSTNTSTPLDPIKGISIRDKNDGEKTLLQTKGNAWTIEIINDGPDHKPKGTAATLSGGTSGNTVTVSVTSSTSRWEVNSGTEVEFHDEDSACFDGSNHKCDVLSQFKVTIGGVTQTPFECTSGPNDHGKCRIVLKTK